MEINAIMLWFQQSWQWLTVLLLSKYLNKKTIKSRENGYYIKNKHLRHLIEGFLTQNLFFLSMIASPEYFDIPAEWIIDAKKASSTDISHEFLEKIQWFIHCTMHLLIIKNMYCRTYLDTRCSMLNDTDNHEAKPPAQSTTRISERLVTVLVQQ